MGPNEHTDAQNIQKSDVLLQVLHQLDRPLDSMDTEWIDRQLAAVPKAKAPSLPAYEQTMRNADVFLKAQKARALRRRTGRYAAVAAAGLVLLAATSFGAANAFQWETFLRIFAPQNGILAFQTPMKDGKSAGYEAKAGWGGASPQSGMTKEPREETVEINSPEELLALSTTGDKAFPALLARYTFQSGNLHHSEYDSTLTLSMTDSSGANCSLQIVTYDQSSADDTLASVFFEIDEDSQRILRIGDDAIVSYTNEDYLTIQWITKSGYCHIWGKAGEEELLHIAKLLLDAGLKPV